MNHLTLLLLAIDLPTFTQWIFAFCVQQTGADAPQPFCSTRWATIESAMYAEKLAPNVMVLARVVNVVMSTTVVRIASERIGQCTGMNAFIDKAAALLSCEFCKMDTVSPWHSIP